MKPDHAPAPEARVRSQVIAMWPVGTFLENLVVLADGSIVVSIPTRRALSRVQVGEAPQPFAQLPGPPGGMALVGGDLIVNVGEPGEHGWALYGVKGGRAEKLLDLPEARFLNGSTVLRGSELLVVDSMLGRVFRVDAAARTYSTWLEHGLLHKTTDEPMMPGVNGVKAFRGFVYFTSTERSLILRTAVSGDGLASSLEVIAERFVGDDFALDALGNLYVTTHVHNQVQRLSPGDQRTVLANASDGMHGSTAAAFGRTASDRGELYVTTTGGIVLPVDGRIREAKLMRLTIGIEGAPLDGMSPLPP